FEQSRSKQGFRLVTHQPQCGRDATGYEIFVPIHCYGIFESRIRVRHILNLVSYRPLAPELSEALLAAVCPREIRDPEKPTITGGIIDIPGRVDHHTCAFVTSLDNRVNKPAVSAR